jgi:hypothetical protein
VIFGPEAFGAETTLKEALGQLPRSRIIRSRPLPFRCRWAYDFLNVFKFFAGFGRDHAGSACLCVRLYVLQHGARDLVDGITVPAGTPTSPGPPTISAGLFTFE